MPSLLQWAVWCEGSLTAKLEPAWPQDLSGSRDCEAYCIDGVGLGLGCEDAKHLRLVPVGVVAILDVCVVYHFHVSRIDLRRTLASDYRIEILPRLVCRRGAGGNRYRVEEMGFHLKRCGSSQELMLADLAQPVEVP